MSQPKSLSVLLLNLFSQKYPAIGESHGLSVVAGALRESFGDELAELYVMDMVAQGNESLDQAVRMIRENGVNVLVVGVPYGTYQILADHFAELQESISGRDALVVFGGALPTYLGSRILKEISREAFIIQGEAEAALPLLIKAWSCGGDTASIPNLLHLDPESGEEVWHPRRLVNLDDHGLPYRDHLPGIHQVGGQIFVETSRGCSWSSCTFCLRGLTDISGRSTEYRRRSPDLVLQDISTLLDLGISEVTFADEDFLGTSLDEVEEFVRALAPRLPGSMDFGASCTVHSVYSRRDDKETDQRRQELLQLLVKSGLKRVFLGVESCSPSQLKRYAKGHTREESLLAMRRLQELGVRVEVGVILLDPLCTLDEVEESLEFMSETGMVQVASGLSNELRLQNSSTYLRMVHRYQQENSVTLINGEMDADTLSFPYRFADSRVGELSRQVSKWSARVHPVYYPAKNLSRFGKAGVLRASEAGLALRAEIEEFRLQYAKATVAAIQELRRDGDPGPVLGRIIQPSLARLASQLQSALLSADESVRNHPVVLRALADSRNLPPEAP
ncbi:radical SAM protein [Actinacidiphila oryziradicis]|uniref:B12-binding domain-containing radical SAM protein n=1 Tax=Actinacidiphila oryziradicis TaxID=2571141 RepID=A0A4U0SIZ3_9ACTN|nr:radical SAM protein [Actinacidiphila oryziradicis]TKA09714.1 B12-binding domain-containing radical SAM protein [Actinacidiphila oryziradicis]